MLGGEGRACWKLTHRKMHRGLIHIYRGLQGEDMEKIVFVS